MSYKQFINSITKFVPLLNTAVNIRQDIICSAEAQYENVSLESMK